MLQFSAVTKEFRREVILSQVSFAIGPGDLALVLGANGSGKSTLLRLAAGLLRPDGGTITRTTQAGIGYLGHQMGLYPALTVSENLSLFVSLTGADSVVDELLAAAGLSALAGRPVRDLSRGQQQRIALLRAFMGQPCVVLLDEPTAPLDDAATELFIAQAKSATARGAAVLIATHDVARLRDHCTRVILLRGGSIAFDTATMSGDQSSSGAAARAQVFTAYQESNR